MISTDMSSVREDLATIEQLVTEFFRSADINKDNFISQEEFVAGVTDMPVILHLLQCDPETSDLEPGPVKKFDSLEELKHGKGCSDKRQSGYHHGNAHEIEERKFAYAAK